MQANKDIRSEIREDYSKNYFMCRKKPLKRYPMTKHRIKRNNKPKQKKV